MNIKGDYPITYHISDNFSQVTSILDFICPSLLLYVSNTFYTFYYNYVILANYLYFGNFRYIQYSNACARAVRNSLKPELKVDAMKRGNSIIKATRWEEGKPVQGKYSSAQYIEYLYSIFYASTLFHFLIICFKMWRYKITIAKFLLLFNLVFISSKKKQERVLAILFGYKFLRFY